MEPPGQPSLQPQTSFTGSNAQFGDAEAEIARVLKYQTNYYLVLKVTKETAAGDIKKNYYKLSRLIHPDKCGHPQAPDAAAVANQAYDTLTNAIKRALYDQYVQDVTFHASEGKTYAEWEAEMAGQPVQIPKWMMPILRIPGGALLLLIILLPLTLILLLLALVLAIVCLPIRILVACVCGPPPPPDGAAPDVESQQGPKPTQSTAPVPQQV